MRDSTAGAYQGARHHLNRVQFHPAPEDRQAGDVVYGEHSSLTTLGGGSPSNPKWLAVTDIQPGEPRGYGYVPANRSLRGRS